LTIIKVIVPQTVGGPQESNKNEIRKEKIMGMVNRREAEAQAETAAELKKLPTEPPPDFGVKEPTDPKDKRISRAGIWQAVASNPGLLGYAADVEALKIVIRELADDGIRYINGK
jgi:hypothetical protein